MKGEFQTKLKARLKDRHILFLALTIFFTLLLVGPLFFDAPYQYAVDTFGNDPLSVGLVFIGLVIFGEIVAPIATLPLAPAVSVLVGPFLTMLFSVVGWTIGAVLAFIIARHLGQPILARFVDMETVKRYESYIPKKNVFWGLVLLRIILPVDVLSYAVGLFSTIRFGTYVLATVIGVIPFSFIWSYGGNALIESRGMSLVILSVSGIGLFIIGAYLFRRFNKK